MLMDAMLACMLLASAAKPASPAPRCPTSVDARTHAWASDVESGFIFLNLAYDYHVSSMAR